MDEGAHIAGYALLQVRPILAVTARHGQDLARSVKRVLSLTLATVRCCRSVTERMPSTSEPLSGFAGLAPAGDESGHATDGNHRGAENDDPEAKPRADERELEVLG